MTRSRVEHYLAHLDEMSGGLEPRFWPVGSADSGRGRVTAIGYHDQPEPDLLIGFTYGLSLARHESWRFGRPELSISVRSDDPAWIIAIAAVADGLRDSCPLHYNNTINFGEPITEESSPDGFVVFAHLSLDPQHAKIDVGDDLPINIVGMYPTYAVERDFINHQGLQAFWELDWDPYDVHRPPAV